MQIGDVVTYLHNGCLYKIVSITDIDEFHAILPPLGGWPKIKKLQIAGNGYADKAYHNSIHFSLVEEDQLWF